MSRGRNSNAAADVTVLQRQQDQGEVVMVYIKHDRQRIRKIPSEESALPGMIDYLPLNCPKRGLECNWCSLGHEEAAPCYYRTSRRKGSRLLLILRHA